jgi:hypothetical protein
MQSLVFETDYSPAWTPCTPWGVVSASTNTARSTPTPLVSARAPDLSRHSKKAQGINTELRGGLTIVRSPAPPILSFATFHVIPLSTFRPLKYQSCLHTLSMGATADGHARRTPCQIVFCSFNRHWTNNLFMRRVTDVSSWLLTHSVQQVLMGLRTFTVISPGGARSRISQQVVPSKC